MTITQYVRIGICLVIFIAGFGSAWKIQGVRLDKAKAALLVCADANAENSKTITALQADIQKMDKSCTSRINGKDQTIRKLKQIDELNGGKKNDKEDPGTGTGDGILDALGGMFRTDSKKGIH